MFSSLTQLLVFLYIILILCSFLVKLGPIQNCSLYPIKAILLFKTRQEHSMLITRCTCNKFHLISLRNVQFFYPQVYSRTHTLLPILDANFRSLRCARITVHMNLFASFALNNFLWLLWNNFVVVSPDVVSANEVSALKFQLH